MNKFSFSLVASALLCTAALLPSRPAQAQPAPAASTLSQADKDAENAAFKEGNAHMEAKEYALALASYKRALAFEPNDPDLLWNGGTAAFLGGDYASALDLWKRLKKLEPRDGAVRAKVIQSYAALGKKPERDRERSELFALRAQARKSNPKSPALAEKRYCRDQFTSSGRRVLAYEFFELEGEFAKRYVFIVLKKGKDADSGDFQISLGSYASDNAYAHESGALKGNARLFHLDGYYAEGLHRTFGFFEKEPSYDQTKALVEDILAGRKTALSSSQRAD